MLIEKTEGLNGTMPPSLKISIERSVDDSSHYYTNQNMLNLKSFHAMTKLEFKTFIDKIVESRPHKGNSCMLKSKYL